MKMKPRKSDLQVINECLDLGIALEMHERRGIRRFRAGNISDEIKGQFVRTTHKTRDLMSHVWINGYAVEALAKQAREKIARKDEILAEQDAAHRAFLDLP